MSDQVIILGVTLDAGLTLDDHIAAICKSSHMQIQRINFIRQYLTNSDVLKALTESV